MYQHIQDHMNCEDIAMSLLISNLTHAKYPIAVDEWGFTSRLQLALKTGYEGIKAGKNHMPHRSNCVDWFATDLQLKDKFDGYSTFRGISTFNTSNVLAPAPTPGLQQILANPRFHALEEKRREWLQLDGREFGRVVTGIRRSLDQYAKSRNLSSEGHG
ncbi:expressed unknown protein [Seminavis robusta]|nr:expressed unknown protein [Seminavis robusta]|eukprot:Sro1948_g307250.1 n/a (159) ;mRNA; r:19029-19505